MRRNDIILWFGRICSVGFTVMVANDVLSDGTLSEEIRRTVIAIVGLVFLLIGGWQIWIAWRYEGMPLIPLPFRWVVAVTFMSWALFVAWTLLISFYPDIYTDRRSSVIWWQFGTSTIWFAARWVTVDTPKSAGIGETGSGTTDGD